MSLSDSHPDHGFTGWRHAYVTGLVAAELMDSDGFRIEVDTNLPVIGIRVGEHRYALIVEELQ